MKYLVFIFLIFSTSVFATNNCTPSSDNCNAYLCMEQEMQCGYKGYFVKYGYKFCDNFLKLKVKSEKLNTWLEETRYCLQEKLTQSEYLSCPNIFTMAIKDHVECYNKLGYCDLSRSEKRFVQRQILKEFLSAPVFILRNIKAFFKNTCRKN